METIIFADMILSHGNEGRFKLRKIIRKFRMGVILKNGIKETG
jgi:hypothetical protein